MFSSTTLPVITIAALILLIVTYTFYLFTMPFLEEPLSKYICCQRLLAYIKSLFDDYGGPYKNKEFSGLDTYYYFALS